MLDVMFYEVFKEEELAIKRYLDKDINAGFTSKTIQETKSKKLKAKCISIRTQSQIPMDWSKKVKGILSRSQGYDHLLSFKKDKGRDISCGYLSDYCSRAVAEHAVFAMFFLLRLGHRQIKYFKGFKRDHLTGNESLGKKALIIGVGRIGEQILDILLGLRMKVKGVDISPQKDNVEYVSLAEGIRWADIIFCALPLTEQTINLLNYSLLKKSKRGALFINISRGEISPIKDLSDLICEGIFGGLSLDVYEDEKVLAQYLRGEISGKEKKKEEKRETISVVKTLVKRDNVFFTPHNAFNTKEALAKKASLSAESVKSFLALGAFPFPVPEE